MHVCVCVCVNLYNFLPKIKIFIRNFLLYNIHSKHGEFGSISRLKCIEYIQDFISFHLSQYSKAGYKKCFI